MYKRQGFVCGPIGSALGMVILGLIEKAVWSFTIPVSYTHLDVYKRQSYTLPQTSGTPRSTLQSVYTASMPVRMEYSVVKIVSRGVSANWPRKAKFTERCV